MYTLSIAIAGITSLVMQLVTKVHCHCQESDCTFSCYDKIRQILSPSNKEQPKLRKMEPLAQ